MEPDLPPDRMALLGQEVNELVASIGELRLALNALRKRVERLERLERERERYRMTGSVAGLEGEWTVTFPPVFEP